VSERERAHPFSFQKALVMILVMMIICSFAPVDVDSFTGVFRGNGKMVLVLLFCYLIPPSSSSSFLLAFGWNLGRNAQK